MIHPEPEKGERAILRHADPGARPLANLERCNAHAREGIERDAMAEFTIYVRSPTAQTFATSH